MKVRKLIATILVFAILSSTVLPAAETEALAAAALESVESVTTSSAASVSYLNGMTTDEYLVTPGDVYNLSFYAYDKSVTYTIVVDTSYTVKVVNLGVINAKGKTFSQLKKEVEQVISANYPMSGVQMLITSYGVFKVTFNGEVSRTTERTYSGLVRLSGAISGVGTKYASSRFVTVVDGDGNVNEYDLFAFYRHGDFSQNPYVRPGDTIILHKAGRMVSIDGSVRRAGTYELKDDENLQVLVNCYADGLDDIAYKKKVSLTRYLTGQEKAGEIIFTTSASIDEDLELKDRDSIYVDSLRSLKKTIFIQGAVNVNIQETIDAERAMKNVTYQFEDGETYTNLAKTHKGWFTEVSDYEKAYVLRDGRQIPIDLYSMVFNPQYSDPLALEEGDILTVPFKQYFVTVSGAVMKPDRYAYVPDRQWDYYVGLAGGFNTELNSREAVRIRTSEGKDLTKDDYILPETNITALQNSFSYHVSHTLAPIATILTIVSSTILTISYINNMK